MAADTWGLSWGGTTGSWLASWASTFVPPTPPDEPAVTPAGRKTRKRRFYVEIDDQQFEVTDANHARALFDRVREVAKSHAEQLASEMVSRETNHKVGKKPIALPTPRIASPDPELRQVVQEARVAINELYRSTSLDTELALLLARRLADEDEEEAILLLM
jgi:hypothetical protein